MCFPDRPQMMEWMKGDCGGAAAVLGAARIVGALQPPGVEAHFIVAACENMINEKGYVPSDILTAMNGKTIEVMNTDAVESVVKICLPLIPFSTHLTCLTSSCTEGRPIDTCRCLGVRGYGSGL